MKNQHAHLLGILTAVFAANAFSSKVLFVKAAYAQGAEPMQILVIRMATALPFFAVLTFLLLRGRDMERPGWRDLGGMTLLGLIGYYLASILDFHGMVYLSAGMERLLLYLYPTFLVILRSLLEHTLPRKYEVLSLALAYAGVALVYHEERQIAGGELFKGAVLVVGAALCFAIYLYSSSHYIKRFGSRFFASWSSSVSCGAMLLTGIGTGALGSDAGAWSPTIILLAVATGIFCTVLPTYAMHHAIALVGSAKVGVLGTTGIIFPLFLGAVLFGEPLSPLRLGGVGLVLAAVLVLNGKWSIEKAPVGRAGSRS